ILAAALREPEQYEQARQLAEDTLTRCRRILGENHPDTLRSANTLATVLANLGERDKVHRGQE
ncbi:MAG TPA: tetratricopeptide repeat protein, partial [Pseudonocardiaceae bacterium]|nr:tetratricopeptide repeat protein [Pseudonocardiaceae bacterium]